jgi:CheY-like chemotaxis protein
MATHSPNVLLLDQDDVLRRATALLLAHRGAGVSPAATVEEAIALSQRRPYDVALLDLSPNMPRARELLGQLCREGLAAQRVVVCTDAPLSREEASDFSDVLLKPYPFDRLIEAVFVGPSRRATRAASARRARVLRTPRRAARGRQHPG